MKRHVLRALLGAAATLVGAQTLGCQDLTATAPLPELDKPYFDCKVQPVLTKSCAMLACHGTEKRYFQVFARNRMRFGLPESQRNDFMLDEERAINFEMARGFVDRGSPETSWLLLKPLEMSAGGYFHGGEELLKRGNVFHDLEDPDYKVLAAWVNGEKEDPACKEIGADQ